MSEMHADLKAAQQRILALKHNLLELEETGKRTAERLIHVERRLSDANGEVLRLGFQLKHHLQLQAERDALAAKLAEQSVPDGYCIAPSARGYARVGAGRYVLQPCLADVDGAEVPSLVIRLATEDECNRRTVGDLEDTPEEEVGVPMDENLIVCQLDFVSDMGLYALQQQLRLLRHYHFPGTEDPECKSLSPIKATAETVAASDSTAANWIDKARDAIAAAESAPKAVRLTDEEIFSLDNDSVFLGNVKEIARAIESAVLRKNGIEVAE